MTKNFGMTFGAMFFMAVLTAMPAWAETGSNPNLPAPYATKSSVKQAKVVGWQQGEMPTAPAGFTVTKFAGDLENPRWANELPNGDVLISEAKTGFVSTGANRVTLLRDADGNGEAETRHVLLQDLKQPFGMAYTDGYLYIANTDAVMRYAYQPGETVVKGVGEQILALPAKGYNNHWTRNLLFSPDGKALYVSVGSASNVGEYGMAQEQRRANILAVDPDGQNERIFAAGLRNPVGMAWEPVTGALWTAVNERDELGDALVPDYITSVTEGGFYGWPYSYWGQTPDPRLKGERPDLVAKAITPDYALGSHTASLGLAFYDGLSFPNDYKGGTFIGQRGSWNRSAFAGYKVVFVPFKNGKPAGEMQDFLTGFIKDADQNEVYGRPVGVTVLQSGALLVTDDAGNTVWHVQVMDKN